LAHREDREHLAEVQEVCWFFSLTIGESVGSVFVRSQPISYDTAILDEVVLQGTKGGLTGPSDGVSSGKGTRETPFEFRQVDQSILMPKWEISKVHSK